MKGLALRCLKGELRKVPTAEEKNLIDTIENAKGKLAFCKNAIVQRDIVESFDDFDFKEHCSDLPWQAFQNFTFNDVCKLWYASFTHMHNSLEKIFENRPNYEIVQKIKSSMWRWGCGSDVWNEVVDAYNCIRSFSFGISQDFEIRLDYTTYYNEYGHAKYSRTYLDGVFAYLVHYKGDHVLTISFSITAGRRILIQQVQNQNRIGNRWLYKLPKERMEFVIDLFRAHFPGYTLYMIDGESLAKKTLKDYRSQLARCTQNMEDARGLLQRKQVDALSAKIAHLLPEVSRLKDLYTNCGRHRLGSTLTLNSIIHRRIRLRRVRVPARVAA